MGNKKNIDHLFQEKLEHLEQSPSADVWLQIQDKLEKKKKRRFPIWWMYSGAAILVIGFLVFPLFKKQKEDPFRKEPGIVVSPKEDPSKTSPLKEKKSPATEKDIISVPKQKQEELVIAKKSTLEIPKEKIYTNTTVQEREKQKTEVKLSALLSFPAKEFNAMSFTVQALNSNVEAKKEPPLKSLFDVVQQEDSIAEESLPSKRWAVLPSYGYTKAASFSNASAIDSRFQNNQINGKANSAIGIRVSYEVSKKWSVRSGVYTQQMSYNTEDVGIVSGITSSNLRNVNHSGVIQVSTSGGNGLFIGSSSDAQNIAGIVNSSTLLSDDAVIQQTYGYTEVPLELTYYLKKKKEFSLGLISGFSTLFLNTNEIHLRASEFRSNLGEANNLNSINFSANFGLDFDYAINKQLFLNLNPMFKVHLNTFSRNSNGFQPYFLGVYTGVKYQF
ncbi:hypothetical protein AAON49_09940 [Pseudotenacibaculum sp. MALMAid0570]|uniref:hypothetical protein n=1 Tax=Pseudotenacibaculum sp. MALMAid0570 TaxID=3143938 RepID=UPI0032E04E1D